MSKKINMDNSFEVDRIGRVKKGKKDGRNQSETVKRSYFNVFDDV